MNPKDVFWLSYRDLGEKKIRTALTIIMVVIGVASIIGLISQTQGLSASVSQELSALGPTSIIVSPTGAAGFTYADTALLSMLPNVSTVTPLVTGTASVYSNGQNVSATIVGATSEGLAQLIGNVSLYQGSIYQDGVDPSSLTGYSIAFPSTGAQQDAYVGRPITIKIIGRNGGTYTIPVVGILNKYGASLIISVDTSVIMSLPAAEAILQRSSFSEIIVKANSTASVAALTTLIGDVYGNKARVLSTQQLTATVSSIIGSIGLLLSVIAGISLLVAAIGIMNIMLISVYERTHEIGIFKAIGFKNRDVLTIFLFQALIIGFFGGAIGIGVGVGASYGISAAISSLSSSSSTAASNSTASGSSSSGLSARSGGSGSFGGGGAGAGGGAVFASGGGGGSSTSGASSITYSPVIEPGTVLAALLVAIIVSVAAGIYPAWRASKLEPIDALRAL
jgi:ABC-type antimicrobial peptide transport system permease subunit